MSKYKGFSVAEVLTTMLIISVITAAIIPLMSEKSKVGRNETNALVCIKDLLAADLASGACKVAIDKCRFGNDKACDTLIHLTEFGSNDIEKQNARKILMEACNQGGKEACKYFVTACMKDSENCDIDTTNDELDLDYYLKLGKNDATPLSLVDNTTPYPGTKFLMVDQIKPFYQKGSGNSNLVAAVNSACCDGGNINLACYIQGVQTCIVSSGWIRRAETNIANLDTWSNRYKHGISLDADNVYFSGRYNNDNYIAALSRADGSKVWEKGFSDSNGGACIQIDGSGNFYVLQSGKQSGQSSGIMLTKYDSSFTKLWELCFSNTESTGGHGLVIKGDFIYMIYMIDGWSSAVAKIHTNGTHQWTSVPTGFGFGHAVNMEYRSLQVNDSGDLYILGLNPQFGGSEHFFTKIDTNGNHIWTKVIAGDATYYQRFGFVLGKNNSIYIPTSHNIIVKYTETVNDPYLTENFAVKLNDDRSNDYFHVKDMVFDSSSDLIYIIGAVTGSGLEIPGIMFAKLEDNGSGFDVLWARYIDDGNTPNYPREMLLDENKAFIYFNYLDASTSDQHIGKISTSLESNYNLTISPAGYPSISTKGSGTFDNSQTKLVTPATNNITTSYSQTISAVDTSGWSSGDMGTNWEN